MKRTIFPFLFVLPLLVACPNSNTPTRDANELYSNNMDFKKWKKTDFDYISYVLPQKFEQELETNYTIEKYSSQQKSIPSLSLYFSVEKFTDTTVTYFQYVNNEKSNLHAIQKNYINSIQNSLSNENYSGYRTSEIKRLSKRCLSQVVIQNFVRQYKWDSDYSRTYFIATKKIKNTFYVFQLIGKSENMKYLQDDFFKIVNSAN